MNEPTPKKNLLGKIALLAHKGKQFPTGGKPSAEELAMLYDDQLGFQRKQEVMSHLNADPVLFEQWMGLVDVMAEAPVEQPVISSKNFSTKLASWLFGWKSLAGGMAAAGFAALLILQQTTDNGLSPSIEQPNQVASQDTKGNIPVKGFVSPGKRAIAAGIGNALDKQEAKQEDSRLLEKLDLSMMVDQQGSALKAPLYQQYFRLGELIVEWEQLCHQKTPPTQEFLQQANHAIEQLAADSFMPLPEAIIDLTQTPSTEQACERLQQFLLSEFK